MTTDEEDTMTILERARALFTGDGDDAPPTVEEVAERRQEVRAEIERLEDELTELDRDEGRRKALAEADGLEDLGRRKRHVRDRIEGLEDLDSTLADRQKEAEQRRRIAEYESTLAEVPSMVSRIPKLRAELEEAERELSSALAESAQVHSNLSRHDDAPRAFLDRGTLRRLEDLVEDLPGSHRLDYLEEPPPAADEDTPRVVYDVAAGVKRVLGDWSDEGRRPSREAGWKLDLAGARGVR